MKKVKILFLLMSLVFTTTSCDMDLTPDSAVPEHEALRTIDDCDAWWAFIVHLKIVHYIVAT